MSAAVEPPLGEKYVEFAEYVDFQLLKARRQIKATDLLTAATIAAVAAVGYVLVFVIADQWLVRGGLPAWLRAVGLVAWLGGLGTWLAFKLVWPWIGTVTALFAAQEVERAEPALHSNLLNWVDLQRAGHKVDPQVLKAIEHRAAVQLSKMDVNQAIDHRPLLRAGYALLAVVCLFSMYAVLSPKKIAPSLARLWPAAETPVPTRTEIREVKPGDVHVLARSWQEITVDLGGVIPPQVRLLYTTADRKFENEPVALQPDQEGSTRYRGMLSGENGQGLLQDLTYRIEAGDAVSREYVITIEQPPSAKVLQVVVHPPEYTRLPAETFPGGNFTGLEGSRVELTAASNMTLKLASVQFLDEPQGKPTGEEENAVVTGDTQITATWTLKLTADGKYPRYFRVHCEMPDGRRDPAPLVYQYTIRKDQPPEIVMISPDRDLTAPANAVIPLLADARDPDFELGPVTLHVERNGRTHRETLFTGGKKAVRVEHELALDSFDLRDGDELTLVLEAQDNRQPQRNRKQTPPLRVRIEPPATPQQVQDQLADARQKQKELAAAQPENNPAEPPDERLNRHAGSPRDDVTRAPPPEPMDRPPTDPAMRDPLNSEPREPNEANRSQASRQLRAPGEGDRGSESASPPRDPPTNDERKLSPDGEDDQEVLRRLHEQLAQRGNSKERSPSEKPDHVAGQSETEQQPGKPQPPMPGGKSDAPGTSDSKIPAGNTPNETSGKPGRQPGDSAAKAEPSSDKRGDAPQTASKDGTTGDRSDQPSAPTGAQAERPETPPRPSDSAGSSKPATKPGNGSTPKSGDNPQDDREPGKSPPGEARPQPGEQPPSKPQPNAEGQPTPAKDASGSDSPEKPGTGDRQAAGSRKNDPQNDEPKAADSKSAAQSGNQKTASQQDQPDVGQSAEKPMAGDSSKPGQSGTEGSAPMPGENRPPMKNDIPADQTQDGATGKQPQQGGAKEKRDGQPGGQDEPAKGTGNPGGQRSDQTQQGEAGGSQQSQTGNKGSQQRGPGESTGKLGEQETGNAGKSGEAGNKSQQPGGQSGQKGTSRNDGNQPGESPSGGEKSGGQSAQGKQGSPSKDGFQGQPNEVGQSGSQSQNANEQEQPSKPRGKPGEQSPAKGFSPSADAEKPAKAGEPQQSTGGEKGAGGDNGQQGASGEKGGGQQPQDGQNAKGQDGQGQPGEGQQPGKQGGQKGGEQAGGEKSGGQQSGGDQPGGQQAGGKQGSQGGAKSAGQKPGDGGSQAQGNEGAGGANGSGLPADSASVGNNSDAESAPRGDAANLDYNRQAAELLLQRLRNNLERGDVDPSLLKELGWTEDEMRRFVDRLGRELDRPTDDESPEAQARRLQFEEMLKSLDLQRTGAKRTGGKQPQRQVDQIDVRRTTAPAEYRKAWENYTRRLLEQKQPAAK